jgi:hypothetical protein
MKRISLKSLADPRWPAGSDGYEANLVSYRAVIEQAIRLPLDRQGGATIDEMRKGIRVLDALDMALDDVLVLEDADWDFLRSKVNAMPWGMVDRRLVTFYDDVMGATDAVPSSNGLLHTDAVAR